MTEELKQRIGPALAKVSSGIYIITARLDGQPVGMLASFIEQAGFEPPMVTAAIGKDRAVLDAMLNDGRFGINVIAKSAAKVIKPFSSPDVSSPFEGIELIDNSERTPQLAEAMAFLQCRYQQQVDAGDHVVVLAEVVDGNLQDASAEPMIRTRVNGFSY